MIWRDHYESPLGGITMASDGEALTALLFDGEKYFTRSIPPGCEVKDLPVFAQTKRWLDIYFRGEDPDFTPALAPEGTPFQRQVWEILLTIPYGRTVTYGKIASVIAQRRGLPRMSAQAAGGAVGRNPISLIIPCHRVVGSDGSLTGYAGGIEKKKALLEMESADMSGSFMPR